MFEGQTVDGIANGFGRIMAHTGDYYIGWLLNGQRHGYGKTVFNDGNYEEGFFKNNDYLGGKE